MWLRLAQGCPYFPFWKIWSPYHWALPKVVHPDCKMIFNRFSPQFEGLIGLCGVLVLGVCVYMYMHMLHDGREITISFSKG